MFVNIDGKRGLMVIARSTATQEEAERLQSYLEECDLRVFQTRHNNRFVFAVDINDSDIGADHIAALDIVERTIPLSTPYGFVSREYQPRNTRITVGDITIGDGSPAIIGGPCSVESAEQILAAAAIVRRNGGNILRGGAFKPRTSPYSFQGLEEQGLRLLAEAREQTGLPVVTEVLDAADVPLVSEYADILQIGSRNMKNYKLLKAVGRSDKPVLLKRGMASKLEELLLSAEYVMAGGNPNIILCERGIRTFVEYSRNSLDLNIIPAIKQISHLPVIVDPSHGTGVRSFVEPMSLAAIACGADGLMIEVHPDPDRSWSDAAQTIDEEQFASLTHKVRALSQGLRIDEDALYSG